MLTRLEKKRIQELEQEAISNYLDRTDFDMYEWISEDDKEEYRKLIKKDQDFCPLHGNDGCEC